MLQNWKHDLVLFIQARTGATLALFVWAALVALASLTAFAFLCVALYDWVALQLNDVFAGLIVAGFFMTVAAIGNARSYDGAAARQNPRHTRARRAGAGPFPTI
jgi:hypothetical protein